jgi:hypothetical protein
MVMGRSVDLRTTLHVALLTVDTIRGVLGCASYQAVAVVARLDRVGNHAEDHEHHQNRKYVHDRKDEVDRVEHAQHIPVPVLGAVVTAIRHGQRQEQPSKCAATVASCKILDRLHNFHQHKYLRQHQNLPRQGGRLGRIPALERDTVHLRHAHVVVRRGACAPAQPETHWGHDGEGGGAYHDRLSGRRRPRTDGPHTHAGHATAVLRLPRPHALRAVDGGIRGHGLASCHAMPAVVMSCLSAACSS